MKNAIIGLLLVTSLALGGLLLHRNSRMADTREQLQTVRKQLAQLESQAAEQQQQTKRLRSELEETLAESAVNAGTAAQLSWELTNRIEEVVAEVRSNTKPVNPLADMFKNPEMRDMIKQQQKAVLGMMVDKNYSDFMKTLQMTPEEEARFKELLALKMSGGAEMGMDLMNSELTSEQREELVNRMKADMDAVTDEIKQFLGEEGYAAYEAYEKTVPDRMAISTFRDQLSGTEMALTFDQEQQLIEALSAERNAFKFTTDFNNQNDISADLFSRFTEENIDRFFQEQERLNQNYLARAQTILTPEQYESYQKSLKAQLEMTKMGMKMAQQMFGTGN